jgi:hypothetical protein
MQMETPWRHGAARARSGFINAHGSPVSVIDHPARSAFREETRLIDANLSPDLLDQKTTWPEDQNQILSPV